jgi:hypothetical protein
VAPEFSAAAAVLSGAVYSGHRRLTELVREGERGQALRDPEGLARTSQRILALPLGEDAYWIGKHFEALAVNRRGKHAFSEANEILIAVADHGPALFRAKSLAAIGTNLYDSGDNKTALEFYCEAAKIAGACERGDLRLVRDIRSQMALIDYAEGDRRRALSQLEIMWPLALQIGIECPPLLLQYYNNLAVALAANDRLYEALRLSAPLAGSPFSEAYPEWGRTRSALLERTRSGSVVSISVPLPIGGDQSAPASPKPALGRPTAPAATVPVGETGPHFPSPAALACARTATGRLRVSLGLCRDLPTRHLSSSPRPNTEVRPLSAVWLVLEQVSERRPVRRPSARAPPPTCAC